MSKKNTWIVGYALCIIVFMIINFYIFYKNEIAKKPIIEEKIKSKDFKYLYNFYIDSDPEESEEIYFGDINAPITMIAYLDVTSEASEYFIKNILPQLKKEHIDKNLLKFDARNHLLAEDYNLRTDKFIYAKYLLCAGRENKSVYYPLYFNLFEINNEKELMPLIKKYTHLSEKFNECIKNNEFNELKEDTSKTENMGLQGINSRFYIGIEGTNFRILDGIPRYSVFNRTINEYRFMIGD